MTFEYPSKDVINQSDAERKKGEEDPAIESGLEEVPEQEDIKTLYEEDENLIDESYPEEDPRRWIKLVESEGKSTVHQYFENLGLSEDMLRKKEAVLDIGSDIGEFSAYCKSKNINDKVVSLEPTFLDTAEGVVAAQKILWGEDVYDDVKKRTVEGVMENLPFKENSFNLIVDHAAMPGFNYSLLNVEQMKEGMEKAFDEIIRVLKPGGEARLFPLSDAVNERWTEWRKAVDAKLEKIKNEGKCSIFLEDVVDSETGELREEKRLIIKKKLDD